MAQSDQWLHLTDDPTVSDRHSSFHFSRRSMRFPLMVVDKSVDGTSHLRKLTSLTYLSDKLRGVFHRGHRDTIVCEEDEEVLGSKRNIYDIIRHSERRALMSTGFDHLAKFNSTVPAVRSVTFIKSTSVPKENYEPSKEQRWCTNCSKCFQRGLSRYDQYCGLDCKTAHRMRQIA